MRFFFFGLLLVFWVHAFYALPIQETFLQGTELYNKGEYGHALQLFRSLPDCPAVVYNKGNCYFHCGDYIRAIACWQSAARDGSCALIRTCEYNIAQAYKKIGRAYRPSLNHYLFCLEPMLLAGICIVLLLLLFLGSRFSFKTKFGPIVGLSVVALLLAVMVAYARWQHHRVRAIVVAPTVPLRLGPSERFAVVREVHQADELLVVHQGDLWYKVEIDGERAWAPVADLILMK